MTGEGMLMYVKDEECNFSFQHFILGMYGGHTVVDRLMSAPVFSRIILSQLEYVIKCFHHVSPQIYSIVSKSIR